MASVMPTTGRPNPTRQLANRTFVSRTCSSHRAFSSTVASKKSLSDTLARNMMASNTISGRQVAATTVGDIGRPIGRAETKIGRNRHITAAVDAALQHIALERTQPRQLAGQRRMVNDLAGQQLPDPADALGEDRMILHPGIPHSQHWIMAALPDWLRSRRITLPGPLPPAPWSSWPTPS